MLTSYRDQSMAVQDNLLCLSMLVIDISYVAEATVKSSEFHRNIGNRAETIGK